MRQSCWLVALAVILSSSGTAWSQDKSEAAEGFDPAEMEKLFEEYATPGTEHKQFRRMVGDWKTKTTSYYPNPEKPTVTEGSAKFRMILGGRFLQQRFQGEYEGKPYTGIGISGYDKATKKYVGSWMDTMGTGIMSTTGKYNEETHQMVESGTSHSPLGQIEFRMVTDYQSDDAFTFTMFMTVPGMPEMKSMEIAYTRQAGDASKAKKPAKQRRNKKKATDATE
ncbi:DUF1579 domain-containing protein [Thalassoroseus pseudoceratinae]|uniref:DUF1579 domain-containing protein n=1 Tax=Thalassoroseus pseudoceratinae TaxID=2713176 RepID=UPI00141D9E46|nr:DUF1579 domain-containing protein [Thalassoroseus pseudoceratinae]